MKSKVEKVLWMYANSSKERSEKMQKVVMVIAAVV